MNHEKASDKDRDMSTISALLQPFQTYLTPMRGDHDTAERRAAITRMLATRYLAWDQLRKHLFNPRQFPALPRNESVIALARQLSQFGWIHSSHPTHSVWQLDAASPDEIVYLRGGWLEEYTWLGYRAAGCDEAYFAQKVRWTVGDTEGDNEIDVIARRGNQLSFASCKSIRPEAESNGERMREFVHELLSWDLHFADTEAKTLLVTTADLIDETRGNLARHPTLLARATVYDLDIVGLEDLGWKRFVQAIEAHWD